MRFPGEKPGPGNPGKRGEFVKNKAKSLLVAECETARPQSNGHHPEEQGLADSEFRYQRLFETAKDGILILDADTGQITDANPFLLDMLGYSHVELLSKTFWEIGPNADMVAGRALFRQLRDQKSARFKHLTLETKWRESRHVEFVSNVDTFCGVNLIQCNIRDISERREDEERVRQVNEDLTSLVEQLRWREREMQILSDMNDLLQSCTTQEEALRAITLKAGQLFVGQSGCLATVQGHDQCLAPVAWWGREKPISGRFFPQDCRALRHDRPHEVVEQHHTVSCDHFSLPPASGSLCVPLKVHGDVLGVLCLIDGDSRQPALASSRLPVAVAAGETIKLVLSNLRLREGLLDQANRDSLTGLFNRRYLDDNLTRELDLSQRRRGCLSVSFLEIDHFKEFNDAFGHDAGDFALRECALILSRSIRSSDIACRWADEEFALVLPDSSLTETRRRVEEMCSLVSHSELRHEGRLLQTLTLSAGIAGSPEHSSTARELLGAAGSALDAAKAAGRARVKLYEPTT